MTDWNRYGGCPVCEATPGTPCRWYTAPGTPRAHTARPLRDAPVDAANLLDDLVAVSVREGVTVHPGDTLVLRMDPPEFMSSADHINVVGEVERIRAYVQSKLPNGARCIVLMAAGDVGVIRGQETPGTAAGEPVGPQPPDRQGGHRGLVGDVPRGTPGGCPPVGDESGAGDPA